MQCLQVHVVASAGAACLVHRTVQESAGKFFTWLQVSDLGFQRGTACIIPDAMFTYLQRDVARRPIVLQHGAWVAVFGSRGARGRANAVAGLRHHSAGQRGERSSGASTWRPGVQAAAGAGLAELKVACARLGGRLADSPEELRRHLRWATLVARLWVGAQAGSATEHLGRSSSKPLA